MDACYKEERLVMSYEEGNKIEIAKVAIAIFLHWEEGAKLSQLMH